MHNTLQGGLHYKLSLESDMVRIATAEIATYNEVAEVVNLSIEICEPKELNEIVRNVDSFLATTGADVVYVNASNFADALIDEFTSLGYANDWRGGEDVLYKIFFF